MHSRVVIDIETAGYPFESLDPKHQEYLTRFAETDEELEQEKLKVNLYPYTAEIVCVGMLNVDSVRGQVLIQAPEDAKPWKNEEGNIEFIPGDEKTILENFWKNIEPFRQFISFNGRSFDAPFLHIRSAMLGVKASRNLMPYRYDPKIHCDLLEQFTFYNAFRKFSLDFICHAFGIESPKRQGVTGLDINSLHRAGHYKEIAEYNGRDLCATRELFLRWQEYMNV